MEKELQREPATPEEIWAILREVSNEQKELSRQQRQTDRQMKKLAGLFTSQWGALMESLVEGDLVPLLQARGVTVRYTHTRMRGRRNGEHYEFDILAENGEEVVVVEVKTTLRAEDVAQFLEKLGKRITHRATRGRRSTARWLTSRRTPPYRRMRSGRACM